MGSRPAEPPPIGQLVDVGGYRLHLACQGAGSRTVVMEAAIGETGLMWSLVQPAVANNTRACVHDRAELAAARITSLGEFQLLAKLTD